MLEKWFYAPNMGPTFVDATYHWDTHIRPIVVALVDGVKKSLQVLLPKHRPLGDLLVHPNHRASLKNISVEKAMDLIHNMLLPDALSLVGRSGLDVLDIRESTQEYRPR